MDRNAPISCSQPWISTSMQLNVGVGVILDICCDFVFQSPVSSLFASGCISVKLCVLVKYKAKNILVFCQKFPSAALQALTLVLEFVSP